MDEQTRTMAEPTISIEGGQGFVRRRLGRGLSALLGGNSPAEAPSAESDAAADGMAFRAPAPHDTNQIHVELIEANPYQPRKEFDPESLTELSESIRIHGVLQPLLVRPCGSQYQLIAGHRRLLASKQAGLETVPCRVLELEDRSMCEAALEENLKRRDLNVLEKAQAFHDYLKHFGLQAEELARQLSMSKSSLSNFLRLLELSEPVKASLLADRVTFGHARALLPLSPDDQAALCQRIETESLSVRQTEATVRELLKAQQDGTAGAGADTVPFPTPADPAAPTVGSSAHVQSLEEQLRQLFGVAVKIKLSGKEKGSIVVPFANNDEFETILKRLRRAA